MNLLVFEWGAYTQLDINEFFHSHNIKYRIVSYHFTDKNNDSFFIHHFPMFLKEDSYDAVFSVNYFPLVARACYENNIKYLSWSYDNPLNVPSIEDTLGLPTNYVFLFDKVQTSEYVRKGFSNVFHLPLAVNTARLDKVTLSKAEAAHYQSQISFVGKLYQSPLPEYLASMDDFCKGYINAICNTQLELYGCYLVDNLISDDILARINNHFLELKPDTSFRLSKEALSYAIGSYITRTERLLLLKLLSGNYGVKLYSREDNALLPNVSFMGSAKYLSDMPKVFKASSINLNITLKILQTGIPLRILDILGSGGFLLSNWQEELAENFEDEREIVMYESVTDAYAKASFYLDHEDLRKRIAQNGYEKAKEFFSYEVQLRKLFKTAGME